MLKTHSLPSGQVRLAFRDLHILPSAHEFGPELRPPSSWPRVFLPFAWLLRGCTLLPHLSASTGTDGVTAPHSFPESGESVKFIHCLLCLAAAPPIRAGRLL